MNQLQTVLDALEDAGYYDSAIAIVKQMMQAEPEIEIGVNESSACRFLPVGTKLYTHPAPQAVPAGFVLVPVEPTIAMKACCELSMANSTSEIYKAMLAAAPKGAV